MKTCRKCLFEKEETDYYKDNTAKSGLRNECKQCHKFYNKEYRKSHVVKKNPNYYLKHKQRIVKRVNEYNNSRDNGLYGKYLSMVSRCKYKSLVGFKYYGGKGIKVEWKSYREFKKDMYDSFLKHQKSFGSRETTLDRINPSKNYGVKNCRWATWKEQANNKCKNWVAPKMNSV